MVSLNELVIYSDSVESAPITLVGAKAKGLLNLPQSWVPKFFVISSKLNTQWNALHSKNRSRIVGWEEILKEGEIQLIAEAIKSLGISNGGRVIVRSSSPKEKIEARGTFISKVSEATPEGILASCDFIYQHASSENIKKHFGSFDLALIVQIYIEPKVVGHLSNERRVSRRRQEWLYELEYSGKRLPIESTGRFALKYGKKRTTRAKIGELIVPDSKALISQLRSVAAYIDNEGLRLHMEWIWDTQKLWIVQGDKDPENRAPSPRSYLIAIKSSQSTDTLKSFVQASSIAHDKWHKLDCPKDFMKSGLPTADLWVLEDASILSELSNGVITKQLRQDIEALLSSPIVIRMDIAPYSDVTSEMLPRSDCVTTPKQTEEFLVEQSKGMLSKRIAPGDFCFIVHHYIPSRSSAFCLAYPNHPRVRIDSIWGLPDGLMFYPHDSFELNPDSLGTMRRHLRFKDNYLAPATDGKWIPVKAGRPYDWAASVNNKELALVGNKSQKLANDINECVQIMWFVDIPSGIGLPPLLPWWYRKGKPPPGAYGADPRVFNRNRFFISTPDDLQEIPVPDGKKQEGSVLRLTPEPSLLRDDEFLREIANKAKQYDMPVELQGSILHHAYYRLKELDVKIHCVDFFTPIFRAQRFGKLVRDKIPLRIKRGGEHVSTIALTGDDLIKVLKAKVIEEALELQLAMDVADIEEELGDVLEVILSIAERMSFSKKELEKRIKLKRKERGGFHEGLLLVETKEVPLIDIDRGIPQLMKKGETARLPLIALDTEDGSATTTARRIPQRQNGEVTIPLVPPDIREVALKIEDLGVILRIRYLDKEVVLRWGREVPKVPREQLRLPGFWG